MHCRLHLTVECSVLQAYIQRLGRALSSVQTVEARSAPSDAFLSLVLRVFTADQEVFKNTFGGAGGNRTRVQPAAK